MPAKSMPRFSIHKILYNHSAFIDCLPGSLWIGLNQEVTPYVRQITKTLTKTQ